MSGILNHNGVNNNSNNGVNINGNNINNNNNNPFRKGLLSLEEEKEALRIAEIGRRAEERAEERAIARALEAKKRQRQLLYQNPSNDTSSSTSSTTIPKSNGQSSSSSNSSKIQFVSKRMRRSATNVSNANNQSLSSSQRKTNILQKNTKDSNHTDGNNNNEKSSKSKSSSRRSYSNSNSTNKGSMNNQSHLTDAVISSVKRSYLGNNGDPASSKEQQKNTNSSRNKKHTQLKSKKQIFKFEWDASDDTTRQQEYGGLEELYGNIALPSSRNKLQHSSSRSSYHNHNNSNSRTNNRYTRVIDVTNKPLQQMTSRDWRIFRENYNILVRGSGGKAAPPPLRHFDDVKLHPDLLYAIKHVCKYKEPSPIQRQAIPIGLQKRDLIGIAETGSGKTAAFGIPLCQFVLNLPSHILQRVPEEGPLALVLAPTRELALQIHVEFNKFLTTLHKHNQLQTTVVVGGQSIQNQAMTLRRGVHIVVGTPGRLNDCLDMRYLVLNQCCYIVLDEADRMIDLGFAPQMEQILENMGGALKSDQDVEEEKNAIATDEDILKYRITAMFSATMPSEVERLAKKYLRNAAIVSIGGQDEGKNARITQRIVYLSHPSQKEKALRDILDNNSKQRRHYPNYHSMDKILIFVNEKKHADGVSRIVERIIAAGRNGVVVLHGGKTQEQREEALDSFKRGGVIMVATDVAGRGLDIPNVTHVINYDLPQRSNIDAYCHRIGRTGRAGKDGFATSFLTDEDESIMPALVSYLKQTKNHIPDRLAKHPSVLQNNERPHTL